ncbi:CHAT domain-containing protein [Mycena rebaudengoi]|nr:CHAT domain-containing protein [Mycena rebaudengoi]
MDKLQKMYEDSGKAQLSVEVPQLPVMHERILLCLQSNNNRAQCLNILGDILLQSYRASGNVDDLNQAVWSISHLTDLGWSLRYRFEQFSSLPDISRSVMMLEAAVEHTLQGDLQKPSRLNELGMSLVIHFQQLGGINELNKSIMMFEDAVRLTPEGHPEKPGWLNNLGNSLLGRFKRLGDLSDLNQSIMMKEDAILLTPDGHPHKAARLNNLGSSLFHRFERLGDLSDLNKSTMMFEDAVRITPDGRPDKPGSLLGRFERLGDLGDLNRSIMMEEDAVQLTPDGHPDKHAIFNNLDSSLLHRFERLGDLSDLNKSIIMKEDVVQLTPEGHCDKPTMLNNLGNLLFRRFERLGDLSDLNKSIMMFEEAVRITPDGHPDKPAMLNHLGHSLLSRFEWLHDPQDSEQMLLHYTLAASSATGPASIRFNAAISWAKHAHIHKPSSILHAYTTAIALIPEVAWPGLSIADRHHLLSQAGQVVRDAASAAIAVHDYEKAVEWLDQGRSVIWGQLLNLRTPVDELRKSHPGLADKLLSLSAALETAATRSNAITDAIKPQPLDSIGQQSHDLVLERNEVLQQIRDVPGFERFLLSQPMSKLLHAAKIGPVAILNISAHGCDALILMPNLAEVMHVPLSDFTLPEAQALAKLLASIVGPPGCSDRLFGSQEGDIAPDDRLPHILSVLWVKIICPILDALEMTTPVSQDLGRIWWCPTGPLAFLPIHAAGLYGQDQAFGSKLSDFLISSYTLSLTALIQGFSPHSESQAELQLLTVTQPSAEGQSHLPGTQEEIECIQRCVKGKKVHLEWLNTDMATIEKVQKGMRNSRWVHFACHGVQSDSPTELTLSNIIDLSLPNAELAFLSACQTATGSQELQDESVHLTAGMLLAGYRGVIGTMWSIDDNDAPQVAGDVYAHLLEVSPADPMRAAQALHLAIQRLREQPGVEKSFLRWVPFIHFGV